MIRTLLVAVVIASSLPFALMAGSGHGNTACPMDQQPIALTAEFSAEGRLLCMHCNLHREDSCRKVFQASGSPEELIDVCPSSKVDLEAVSQEGAVDLRVAGKMVTSESGSRMLVIESAEPVVASE